jgi:ribosomal protein S21
MKYLFLSIYLLFYSFNSYSVETIVQNNSIDSSLPQQKQQINKNHHTENIKREKNSANITVNRKKQKTITVRYYTEDDCD